MSALRFRTALFTAFLDDMGVALQSTGINLLSMMVKLVENKGKEVQDRYKKEVG